MTAYNYRCPHCHADLEFDEDPTGQSFDCISCGKRFTVYSVNAYMKKRAAVPQVPPKPPKLTGCVWLGFIFSVIGILIAYLTNGQNGAKAALKGFVYQIILGAVSTLVIILLPSIEAWIVS